MTPTKLEYSPNSTGRFASFAYATGNAQLALFCFFVTFHSGFQLTSLGDHDATNSDTGNQITVKPFQVVPVDP